MKRFPRLQRTAILLGLLVIHSGIQAQTSGVWTTVSPDGNSGSWSDPTKWTGGVPSDGGSATFGAYANPRVITLDGDYTIGTLALTPRTAGFVATAFTLQLPGSPSGSEILRINGGLTVDTGATANINVPIEVTANQSWSSLNSPGGSATFGGVISGTGRITRGAAGPGSVFTFTGANTFSGGYLQTFGALPTTAVGSSSVVTGGVIESGPLGTGVIELAGGSFRAVGGTARTIHNSIVVGGGLSLSAAGNAGALTFSDAGLSTASIFTLNSATAGNVTVLRTGAGLTFDQVIAESGATGQSVLFSGVSGTPTVTLNRTKTASGSIVAGGVNLVLANGEANPGSLIGVEGSVTATGSNRFGSGAVVLDGTSAVASTVGNFDGVAGPVNVYNNGRVTFTTPQSQAAIAALFAPEANLTIGIGSSSESVTVSESYDQAAIGSGLTGLVSSSTGTMTYTGTLGAGSDDVYRVGGGLGTLALTGTTLAGANDVLVSGGGTLAVSGDQSYTGSTAMTSNVTLSGADGSLSGTSGIAVNANSTLSLSNNTGAVNANRINNSADITLNNGTLTFGGSATSSITETANSLIINGGRNLISLGTTPTGGATKTLSFSDIARNNGSVLVVRGDALGDVGGSLANRNAVALTSGPTLVGGGGAAGTTNISILPWARGGNSTGTAGNTLLTYENGSFRPLNTTTEFTQASTSTPINTAVGANTDRNVRVTGSSGTMQIQGAAATSTVNAMMFDNSGASGAVTFSLNGGTVNVTSGALHLMHSSNQNYTVNNGTLDFGTAEGVITANSGGSLATVGANLAGSGGVSVYAINSGNAVQLSGNNSFTGGITLGSGPSGYIGVDQDTRFGNAANAVTLAGGQLRFFTGFTTARGLILLGDVGDNALANNSATTHTWNGDISGAGRLRLINNASSASTAGFVLGGANTYTGGTQIEGVNVTAATNTALGTGTVSLLGSSHNVASLNLTGSAAELGGLRGTDGLVTINPTGPSATLTVGANGESTVFAGTITEGSGKVGSLDKVGSGTLVLAGNNTFTGATTVTNGGLLLAGTLAGDLAVGGGNASISGGLGGNLSMSSGSLAVGEGIVLPLTMSDNTSFSITGGTWKIDITSGSSLDQIFGGGTGEFSLTGGTLEFAASGILVGENTYQLFSGFASGSASGFDWNFTTPLDPGVSISSVMINGDGLLTITAVPEPSSWALMIAACLLLACVWRRKQREVTGA